MAFELPALPYARDALAPHISAETIDFHYGKHHQTYVDKLNAAVEGKPEAEASLEEPIKTSSGGVFNNAAQIWNHTFYWNSLSPNGGGAPTVRWRKPSTGISAASRPARRPSPTPWERTSGPAGLGWSWMMAS